MALFAPARLGKPFRYLPTLRATLANQSRNATSRSRYSRMLLHNYDKLGLCRCLRCSHLTKQLASIHGCILMTEQQGAH